MKYKVGDTARVKSKEAINALLGVAGHIEDVYFSDDIYQFCGSLINIDSTDGKHYMWNNSGDRWWFSDAMLEDPVDEVDNCIAENDPVNHPSHYASGGIECIEAMKASMTPEAFCGYLKGNAMKYLWRYEKKIAPIEDLKKAIWYMERLVKEQECK